MRMRQLSCQMVFVVVGGLGTLAGCGQPAARPLPTEQFLPRRQVQGVDRAQAVDQPGQLLVDTVNPPTRDPDAVDDSPVGIPPSVQDTVQAPGQETLQEGPDARAADRDARPAEETDHAADAGPAEAALPEGSYQLVGTVLATVNTNPIYADHVLKVLEKPLQAEARKQPDEAAFKAVAADLISKQIAEFINAELEFATAQRRLDERHQAEARALTVQWRLQQVTEAGGSEELARKKWAAEGYDFEERVEEQYRTIMRQLYYARKEAPKIQVRQRDLRDYYEANREKEFTTHSAARFRVIKVDFERTGGREAALRKAQEVLKRAKAGEDFAAMAEAINDEAAFKRPLPPVAKGAFAIDEVEEAVWALEPGQVSDLIETEDAFYIARLEQKEAGRVVPFEEAQEAIGRKLRMQQFAALRSKVQADLRRDAAIKTHPQMLQIALDMAMQRYPRWVATR